MDTVVMVEQWRSAAARRAPTGWPHRIHPALAKRMVTVSPGPARVTVAPLETAAMQVSPGMRRTVPVVLRCSRSAGLGGVLLGIPAAARVAVSVGPTASAASHTSAVVRSAGCVYSTALPAGPADPAQAIGAVVGRTKAVGGPTSRPSLPVG